MPDNQIKTRLQLGTSLQLSVKGMGQRLNTTLIGEDCGEFLIIKPPTSKKMSPEVAASAFNNFLKDKEINAKYMLDGRIFAGKSRLLMTIPPPIFLFFIQALSEVSEINLRQSARLNCLFPIHIDTEFDVIQGTIDDISNGGCRLIIKLASNHASIISSLEKIGTHIKLSVTIPGCAEDVKVKGIVRNIKKDAQQLSLGVEFVDGHAQIIDALDEFALLAE